MEENKLIMVDLILSQSWSAGPFIVLFLDNDNMVNYNKIKVYLCEY